MKNNTNKPATALNSAKFTELTSQDASQISGGCSYPLFSWEEYFKKLLKYPVPPQFPDPPCGCGW